MTRLDIDHIPSKHPGTANSETPFNMVAEPAPLACEPSTTRSNDINHPSSLISSWTVPSHLLQQDPYELPDSAWTPPSTSSGGHPPEASDIQLDQLYKPRPHRVAHHDSPAHLQQASSTSASQMPLQATSLEAHALASGSSSQPPWTSTSRQSVAVAANRNHCGSNSNSSNIGYFAPGHRFLLHSSSSSSFPNSGNIPQNHRGDQKTGVDKRGNPHRPSILAPHPHPIPQLQPSHLHHHLLLYCLLLFTLHTTQLSTHINDTGWTHIVEAHDSNIEWIEFCHHKFCHHITVYL